MITKWWRILWLGEGGMTLTRFSAEHYPQHLIEDYERGWMTYNQVMQQLGRDSIINYGAGRIHYR